ncbi:DUF3301 domain-containing protein [Dyella japonica]|uniref:DUF3301 domain-containing protein n=1 Tax=Dyella japonica A8 TaxID=1217721 RepID=A0A075K0H2_9GAMM|nr:DUF3301 domain-containing protein [Dyella japonica]AIF47282.1 hypothetical protein HY57_08340 [Dyella japonica A8]
MSELPDLVLLLGLLAVVGLWLKLARGREQATQEARLQCRQHGLQLLDESVGLRGVRLLRQHGQLLLERCYTFEVSIDGNDREPGKLWLIGRTLSGISLPTIQSHLPGLLAEHTAPPAATDNVVPLRPRLHKDNTLH